MSEPRGTQPSFTTPGGAAAADRQRVDAAIAGWSGDAHWSYFQDVVARGIRSVCMLGVYQGRDIAYLLLQYHAAGIRDFRIVGVDLFRDVPGADWPAECARCGWQQAGFGEPPSLARARANLSMLPGAANVELVESDAASFLSGGREMFEMLYVDIAHDYTSTRDAILAGRRRLGDLGVFAGDDFSNQGTWGVERAVKELFVKYSLFGGWIWEASPRYLLRPAD